MNLVLLTDAHLPALQAIEKAVQLTPWADDTFRSCLSGRETCWGYEDDDGRLLAFAIVQDILDERHLLNIAVDPNDHRRGLGQQLLRHVINSAIDSDLSVIYLEVRKSNRAAIKLYKKHDFSICGQRKNYYARGEHKEDAVLMLKHLPAAPIAFSS